MTHVWRHTDGTPIGSVKHDSERTFTLEPQRAPGRWMPTKVPGYRLLNWAMLQYGSDGFGNTRSLKECVRRAITDMDIISTGQQAWKEQ
jgi:hypothetical protein